MRILADTHALLWWWTDDTRLSARARDTMADPTNNVLVSTASAWEIATKNRLRKLGSAGVAADRFEVLMARDGFEDLPVRLAHGLQAGRYPHAHNDPFDRMLAAQAELDAIPLVTIDPQLRAFPIEIVW